MPRDLPRAPTPADLPDALAAVTAGVAWEPVTTQAGAAVFRGRRPGGEDVFLKTACSTGPGEGAELLRAEHERLDWFAHRLPVPEILAWVPDDGTGTAHLLTRALPGTAASSFEHLGDVEVLLRALADGVRRVHELPVGDCPFDATLPRAVALAGARVEAGLVDESDFEPAYRRYGAAELYELLVRSCPPGEDDLVVTHGDCSLSNLCIDRNRVVGYVDLGRAGVADRYVDLAVLATSLAHEISPHALGPFFDAYGIDLPDLRKVDFYVLLDEFF